MDVLKSLESDSVQTCVTSPPYWGLRDYGVDGQLGHEPSAHDFILNLVKVFREVRRVLKEDGTLWVNMGDSYARTHHDGFKRKDLIGVPWRLALALQADGWFLRQDIIWSKTNAMPESVTDRCVKSHEYIFLLSKSPKYFFDHLAIRETAVTAGQKRGGGKKYSQNAVVAHRSDSQRLDRYGVTPDQRNKRSVWNVSTKAFRGAHFATFPVDLITPCILAGSRVGDTVLDPFFGAGTVGVASLTHQRKFVGIELNEEFKKIAEDRIAAMGSLC